MRTEAGMRCFRNRFSPSAVVMTSAGTLPDAKSGRRRSRLPLPLTTALSGGPFLPSFSRKARRSEERRVGKECRSLCDWSSDVCSSDLLAGREERQAQVEVAAAAHDRVERRPLLAELLAEGAEIGRASCRERV